LTSTHCPIRRACKPTKCRLSPHNFAGAAWIFY